MMAGIQEGEGKRKKTDDFKEDLKALWTDYLSETSLHGCHSILKANKHWIRRLLWFAVVIVSATLLLSYIYNFYFFYNSHPFITKTRVERLKSMPLPALSFCEKKLMKNTLNNIETLEEYTIASDDFVKEFGEFNITIPSKEDIAQTWKLPYETIGQRIDDLIIKATIGDRKIDVSKEFVRQAFIFGDCFTFNGISEDGTGGNISLSYGQTLNMILNISQHAYYPTILAAGTQFFVHDPQDPPSTSSLSVHVSPGFRTSISLMATKMKFLPKPYLSYGDDYCVETKDAGGMDMLWHARYTWSGCVEECLVKTAINKCKCRPTIKTFPESLSDDICTYEDTTKCITPMIEDMFNNVLKENDTVCNCPQPCEFMQYDVLKSQMAFPTKPVADFLVARGAASSYQSLRDNYLKVDIHFQRMVLQHVEHVPEIDSGDILGRLGGQMGLFLGASLLTLTELAETILMSLMILIKYILGSCTRLKIGAAK